MRIELNEGPDRLTRRHAIESARTVQQYAESLVAHADRVLTRCITGQADPHGLTEDLHAIDRSAASIRMVVCGMDASTR